MMGRNDANEEQPVKPRERFWGVVNRTPIDRLPLLEWAPWWNETLERWYGDGLPRTLTRERSWELTEHFGLDDWRQTWIRSLSNSAPAPASHGAPLVRSRDEYNAFQEHLWPEPETNLDDLRRWADRHASGDTVVWIMMEGFFWFPRRLLGIEQHLYAFYDEPALMHDINKRLVEHLLHCLDVVEEILTPDMINFAEDLAYNHGPMLSKELWDEFIAPYYRQVLPRVARMGTITMMDSDGQMDPAIPWLLEVGLDGVEPLERQAGVDINALRAKYPGLKMMGAFDKMTMPKGEAAMRAEFERILPVMASGGYFAGCDHQTPPGVSLENYHIYLKLFEEYATRAVADW